MNKTLLLASARTEDQIFMKGVAATTGFPLVIAASIEELATLAQSTEGPIVFAEVACDESFRRLRAAFEPLIRSDPAKYGARFLHAMTSHEWSNLFELSRTNLAMHLIFRNKGDPEIPGREYGHILRSAHHNCLFGIENHLSPGANVRRLSVRTSSQKPEVLASIAETLRQEVKWTERAIEFLVGATDELLMNAMYDAPAAAIGAPDSIPRDLVVDVPQPEIEIKLGFDDAYVGLSVLDYCGSLKPGKLMAYLLKSYRNDYYEIDETKAGAGLGLSITLKGGANLLFATEPKQRTEVTVLVRKVQSWKELKSQYRFVSINVSGA